MTKTTAAVLATGLMALVLSVACSGQKAESNGDQKAGPIAAGSELPPDHPPLPRRQDEMIAPVDPSAGTGASGLAWDAPEAWVAETPANTMRRAQYRVPGPGGDAGRSGECVVFYFGPGQGGDPMSNAIRWANQFVQPEGSDSVAHLETEEIDIGGIPVLKAEVSGTYRSGSPMMGGSGELLPDHKLLGAIARGTDANWFFKFTGPSETVEANRAAFEAMLGSLRRGE
ncbi:MAG: hypothetical protein ACE5GX_17970 [Thermoanaerobaculia bacterium]